MINDIDIQTCINILKEAKGSSEDFKKARLEDCLRDLENLVYEGEI